VSADLLAAARVRATAPVVRLGSRKQAVLVGLLAGASVGGSSRAAGLDRRTVGRWWNWLQARGERFAFCLRSRFPEWGRHSGFAAFWLNAFEAQPLCSVMAWLDRDLVVP
jgi:hypothetical protein